MKLKAITEWCERWSTPSGTMDAHAPVADGVLVGLSNHGRKLREVMDAAIGISDVIQ